MKKYFFLFIVLASSLAAFETTSLSDRQQSEFLHQLAQNQSPAYRESFFYTKFDTYSRFLKKDISETEIATKYGIGWRYRKSHHGFSVSVSGHESREFFQDNIELSNTIDTETGNVKVIKTRSLSGSYYYANGQVMYHYYFNPSSFNSFYLGAGVEADRYTFHLRRKGTRLNMGFLTGMLAGGYQFKATDNINSFIEFQVGQPAYVYTATKQTKVGYTLMEKWTPTVSFSIGIGF
jgi:hypothetical protein